MRSRVIVVGGGTMGLAVAAAIARRGREVLVLERWGHVHEMASHGGHTRVTRHAYHEGSAYVPLVRESEAVWAACEAATGERLYVRTGLIEAGPPEDRDFQAVLAACEAHAIPHAVIEAREANLRWPLQVPEGWLVCHTLTGGYLRVKACMDAMRREAESRGVVFRYGERVREIGGGARLHVLLESGEILPCEQVVVAAGAFARSLLPSRLAALLAVRRRVLAWSSPSAASIPVLRDMPVWCAFRPEGLFYGFPWGDEGTAGCKLACHVYTAPGEDDRLDADAVDREIHAEDLAPLAAFQAEQMPAARGPWAAAKICLYGCTPTGDFMVDVLPDDPRVVVAVGFSGHGFKFAPSVGRLCADLVEGRDDALPSIFRWEHHLAGPRG